MVRRLLFCFVLAICTLASMVHAQNAKDALASLQGRWVVTGGEHNASPLEAIKGGIMTISADRFEIHTASGNVLQGTLLVVNAAKSPHEMDLLHADGVRWEAIYELQNDGLRLNYVAAGGKDPRPTTFTTSQKTEESLVILRRETR